MSQVTAKNSLLAGLDSAAAQAPQRQTLAPSMPSLHIENQGLKERIRELESAGAGETFKLSPAEVVVRAWTNRSADSFRVKDFAELREKIKEHAGNYIPIVVNKVQGRWHLVCGRRRMQACKELGLQVNAVELKGEVSDLEIFAMMHGENQDRTRPALYEVGLSIERFIAEQTAKTGKSEAELFSLRGLEEIVGLSHTSVRMARELVAFPDELLLCFENATQITTRHVQDVLSAMSKDREAVLARAKAIFDAGKALSAGEAVLHLCHDGGVDGSQPEKKLCAAQGHKPFGSVKKDAKGGYTLTLVPGFKYDHMERLKKLALELASENEVLMKELAPKPKPKKAAKPGKAAAKKTGKGKVAVKSKTAPQADMTDTQAQQQG